MMRFVGFGLRLGLCALALAGWSASGRAQDEITVSGTVRDGNGKLLAKAVVEAVNGRADLIATAETNDKGVYSIKFKKDQLLSPTSPSFTMGFSHNDWHA